MGDTESIECPSCRKDNALAADLRLCMRCGCELEGLARILTLAKDHLEHALASMVAGDWESAIEHAVQSWDLRHSSEAARIGFLANAAKGELDQAGAWLRSISR